MISTRAVSGKVSAFLRLLLYIGFGLVLVVFIYLSGVRFYASDTTPVVDRQILTGLIATVHGYPITPRSLVHSGIGYRYGVRLDGGEALVFVQDIRPRPIGSPVLVERLHHADGYDEYRMSADKTPG